MKGKLLKKLVAAVSALSMLASVTFVLPANAADLTLGAGTEADPYINIDFSGDTAEGKVWGFTTGNANVTGIESTDGWITYYVGSGNRYAGKIDVSSDGNPGNCAAVSATNFADADTKNKREPSIKINKVPDITQLSAGQALTYQFDFKTNSTAGAIYLNDDTDEPDGDFIKLALTKCPTNIWLTAVLTIDPSKKQCVADIYNGSNVIDTQSKEYTTTGSPTRLRFLGASSTYTYSIDNIKAYSKNADISYTISYSVDGNITNEIVKSGNKISNIPDTTVISKIFDGWQKDGDTSYLYSNDELKTMDITDNITFTAVYHADTDYIEPIASVVLDGPQTIAIGADSETAADNKYTVKITGQLNSDILANPDNRVKDFNVAWDFRGFKTENDLEGQYCDSYGAIECSGTANSTANFKLRNMPFNFYGTVQAIVTYNNQTYKSNVLSAVVLGNTAKSANQILPEGGYPSDFDAYSDDLIGYATEANTYANPTDVIVGGWDMSGSDGSKSAVITEEKGNKFLRISAPTQKKSHMFTNIIDTPKTQAIFEQDMRFGVAGASITLTEGYPFWSGEDKYKNPVTLLFNGTTITLNDEAITKDDAAVTISANTWYKVVLSIDKTTETCYTQIYDMNGTLLGTSGNVNWKEESNPVYYSVGFGSGTDTGILDFDNYKAYYPVADLSQYTLVSTQDTLSIPNGDTAVLTASLKSEEGYNMTADAEWVVLEEDMKDGVIITPDATDSHKATVTLAEDAAPGTATVQVNIAGNPKTIALNITSSAQNIKFLESVTSIGIPLDASARETAKYTAVVASGTGETLNTNVTYAIYDKTGTNPYTLPAGITFEAATGTLTVDSTAVPAVFTVKATGKDTDSGADISRGVVVTVHGSFYDFGKNTEEAVAENYTAVTKDTLYTAARGYGIVGTAEEKGTDSATDPNADYLEGRIQFKAKVQPKKVYEVELTYQGAASFEAVNGDLDGARMGQSDELTAEELAAGATKLTTSKMIIPVIDDVLDLTLLSEYTTTDTKGNKTVHSFGVPKIASIKITKLDDKAAADKPNIYHVGDSTSANNGSWAYYIDHNRSAFPELDALATFYNSGAGGRNLVTYYQEGKLLGVLNNIRPGDIVVFGNNGTNGMGSFFEENVNYYLDAFEAFGAKIILNSYTPHGAVGGYTSGYDSATHTFNSWRQDSYDVILRKVAKEREEKDPNYLGFVEIGKNADMAFNAYVAAAVDQDAAAQEIISCFSDHNHYSNGSKARELMLDGYGDTKGIVAQLVDIISNQPIENITASNVSVNAEGVATATVKNTTGAPAKISLFSVSHNTDGTLASVKLVTQTVAAGETLPLTTEALTTVVETPKAFVWNMAGLTPLAKQ